jgi:hypothetical protein
VRGRWQQSRQHVSIPTRAGNTSRACRWKIRTAPAGDLCYQRSQLHAPKCAGKGETVGLDVESLKAERDKMKEGLRELEAEQRKLDAEIKSLRQREIQAKREIEALGVLIEINDSRVPDKAKEG